MMYIIAEYSHFNVVPLVLCQQVFPAQLVKRTQHCMVYLGHQKIFQCVFGEISHDGLIAQWNVCSHPLPPPVCPRGGGGTEIRNFRFQSPPPPGHTGFDLNHPLVMVTNCKGWQNLQVLSSLLQLVMKLFTVSDKTYIGTHRTVPVSLSTFTVEVNHNPVNCHKGAYW